MSISKRGLTYLALFLASPFALTPSWGYETVDPLLNERIPGLIFYEKSAHMLFTITTPFGAPTPLLVTEKEPCPTIWWGDHCTLIHYLEKIRDELQPLITPTQTLRKEESTLPSLSSSCGKINPLFPSLFTESSLFTDTRDNLTKCLGQSSLMETVVDYSKTFEGNYHLSMNWFDSKNPPVDPESLRLSMIVQEMLNIGGFVHHMAEKSRWEEAASRCKFQHTLPPSLVTTPMLKENLGNLLPDVEGKGYEFSVLSGGESLSAYWTLPTVDCTFSSGGNENQVLNVLMAVPLKKAGRDWSLNRLRALPFHREWEGQGYICVQEDFRDQDRQEQEFYFDSTSKREYRHEEGDQGGILRHISTKTRGFLRAQGDGTTCVSTLLHGNPSPIDIVQNCRLTCIPEATSDLDGGLGVVVAMGGSDLGTFYIARGGGGESTTQVEFQCPGESENSVVDLPLNGATRVVAPCGCKLIVGGVEVAEVELPCGMEPLQTVEVRPIHFQEEFADSLDYKKTRIV